MPRAASADVAALARVTIYDDGVKLRGEPDRALPKSPFSDETAPIALFALPGETVSLQLVVDAEQKLEGVHAEISLPADRAALTDYAEQFVRVERPSGNDREPGSLAFSASAAPPREAFVGLVADALLPRPLDIEAHGRGALWVDLFVPETASAGAFEGTLLVSSQRGVVAQRRLSLTVGTRKMPFAAAQTAVFYDPSTLERRMGSRAAELSLRQVLHAHHVSALPERTNPEDVDLDLDALSGALYTQERGYHGPGQGTGDGVYAIGAYGSLGDPTESKVHVVERFVERIRERGALANTEVFVYAVDEDCKSPRAARWLALLAQSSAAKYVRVGVTCGEKPERQAATLVMIPAAHYDPEAADRAKALGKSLWAYNGIRPQAGPLMLDVPAVDLRANAWIAMRYGITRWFYWESTYWLDANRGGRGGAAGWDPFIHAETFHNADGDYAMGDGILVYPGTQRAPMTDFGEPAVYPSVRLKNLRRGVLDAGYVALARERDRDRTDAIVRRMIPGALALVRDRDKVAWSDDAEVWRSARQELFAIAEGPAVKGGAGHVPAPNRLAIVVAALVAAAAAASMVFRRFTRR